MAQLIFFYKVYGFIDLFIAIDILKKIEDHLGMDLLTLSIIFITIIGIIFYAAILVYTSYRTQKKRRKEIRQFVRRSEFKMARKKEIIDIISNADIELFNQGYSKDIENIFSFLYNDTKMYFFDYSFIIRSGRRKRIYNYTVAIIKTSQKIPSLSVIEDFLEGLKDQDIEIESYNGLLIIYKTDKLSMEKYQKFIDEVKRIVDHLYKNKF
jgi:hypothetical protein